MRIVQDLTQALLLVALFSWLGRKVLGRWMGESRGAVIGCALAALLTLLPLGTNPLHSARSPSALGIVLLLHLLLRSVWGKTLIAEREEAALAWPAILGAALIYPASLGVPGMPDFYLLGYAGWILPTATFALALLCLWRRFLAAALALAGGLLPSVVVVVLVLVRRARHRRLRGRTVEASLAPSPLHEPA